MNLEKMKVLLYTFNYRICTYIFDSRLCTCHVNYYMYYIDVCGFFVFFFQNVSLFLKSDTFQAWGPSCPHPFALSYYCAFICERFSGTEASYFSVHHRFIREESNFRRLNRAISAPPPFNFLHAAISCLFFSCWICHFIKLMDYKITSFISQSMTFPVL